MNRDLSQLPKLSQPAYGPWAAQALGRSKDSPPTHRAFSTVSGVPVTSGHSLRGAHMPGDSPPGTTSCCLATQPGSPWETPEAPPFPYPTNPTNYTNSLVACQGLAGSWDSGRGKNIHGAAGMSDMSLFKGGQFTHAASCVSICMSHVVVPAPQRGTHPLVCLLSSSPPAGSPYLFKH